MPEGSSWPASLPFKEHLSSTLHFLLACYDALESIIFHRRVHSFLSETEGPAAPITVSTLAWPTARCNKQCPRVHPCPNTIRCWLSPPLKSEPKGIGRKPTSSLAPLLSGKQNQSPLRTHHFSSLPHVVPTNALPLPHCTKWGLICKARARDNQQGAATATYLNDEGFRGGTPGMEELWGQITLRATVIVHNCASYVQCSAEVNGPMPVQIILPSHVLDSWTNPCAREEKAVNLHTYNPIPGSTYHMTEPALDFQGIGNPQSSQLHHLNPCSFTSTLQPFKCGNNLIWQHLPTQQKSTHQKGTVRTQQGCSCFHSTPHCRSSKKMGPWSSNNTARPVIHSCQKLLHIQTVVLASFAADQAFSLLHNQMPPVYSSRASAFPTISHWGIAYVPLAIKMRASHLTAFTPLSCSPDILFRRQRLCCCIHFSTKENITRLICPKHWAMEESKSRRVFAFCTGIASALPRKLGKLGEDFSSSFLPSAAWPEFEVVHTNTQKVSIGKSSPSQTFGWQEELGFTLTKQPAELIAKFCYIN